jgi:hypothetical protein
MQSVKRRKVTPRQISDAVMAIAIEQAEAHIMRYVYNTKYTDPFLMADEVRRIHRKAVAIHQAVFALSTPIDNDFAE